MLSRKFAGSASFVCLRCRLQLARTSRSPPFAALTRSSFSSLRCPPRQQQQRSLGSHARPPSTDADEPARQSDRDPQHNGNTDAEQTTDDAGRQTDSHAGLNAASDADTEPTAEPAYPYPFVKPPDLSQSYEPPAPQMYKSRGRFVSPSQEGISIDILGKPGFAVVLRERESVEKQQRALPELKPDHFDASDQVDPATFLQADEGTDVTHEEVLLNIHELKPTDSACLSVEEFDRLKETLVDGFTSPQLASYIDEDRESRRFSGDIENSLVEAPWVLEVQPWAPLTGGAAAGGRASDLSGYIINPRSRKERLAVQVLRECWNVGSKADVNRDGSTSITLRDVEFSILTVGNRRWLEGMSRPVLAQVKEVRFVRGSRTVSIVAPRYPARLILKRIEKVLSTCRTADFPVALVSPEPGVIHPGVLDEIGRVTNTVTRFDPSGEKIAVTWVQMSNRDAARESAIETVLRFLREAYWPNPRVSTGVESYPKGVTGRYIPILNCADKLPWHERDKKWARLSAPVGREPLERDNMFPVFTLPLPMGPESAPGRLEGSVDRPRGWSAALQTDTSAVFGHVGFTPKEQAPPGSPPVALDSSLPRTFVPILPSLFSINLPSNLHEHGLWHTTTVIRFAPSPDTPPDLAASAPTLELRIDADHREINGLTSLRAIKHIFTNDCLFPEGTTDVRFVQQQYFELPGSVIGSHVEPLLEFLNKSDLRPWESKFSTPPGLRSVRLPRRFFSTDADEPHSQDEIPDDDSSSLVELDYNLASVEVRRDVTAEYKRLKLRYTRVRAGALGGEWSQLSLDAVEVDPEGDIYGEEQAPYEIAGHRRGYNRKFLFHTANKPKRKTAALDDTVRPANRSSFVNAVRQIVKGEEDFKWIETRRER